MKRILLLTLLLTFSALSSGAKDVKLLNVSYDPTRELYEEYNKAFADYWQKKTGDSVTISQSHGGSGKQALSVINGLEADVVTLALAYDIDSISSGGARWAYLAAYGYALEKNNHDDAAALMFIKAVYRNAPVLDSGARGATLTFAQRNVGDVLLAWENEAHLALKEFGEDKFEIVTPSISVLAEPPVAVITKIAEKHGTADVAKAYLQYLYSPEAQEIEAKNFYRPRDKAVAAKYASNFANVKLFTIDEEFGGWTKAQKRHFADGGVFDQLYNNL